MRKIALIAFTVLISFQILAQVPNYVPTNGLVGWWPFTGNANDESGNGNNGTVNGATLTSDRFGNANKAYTFDGVNDYIDYPSGANSTLNVIGDFTISFWLKTDQGTSNRTIISFGNQLNNNSGGITIGINDGITQQPYGRLGYATQGQWNSSSTIMNDDLWHFIVITLNGNTIKLFVDTIPNSTNLSQPAVLSWGGNRRVGAGNYAQIGFYEDLLDDIGIWNRALTQQEITALYTGCVKSLAITPSINAKTIGSNATFTATTTASNPSYIWQSDLGQGFQTLNNVGQYSGTSTNAMSISNVQLSNHMEPIRAISTSGTCKDTSNIAYVKILDTCITKINDTVKITKYDTVKVTRYDTIKVTKYDTIKVTDTLVINATLSGVSAPNNTNRLIIYPNPAKDHITIDYGIFGRMSGYTLKIVNTLGQIVFSTPINQQTSYINLSTWTGKGMYYVQIYDASNTMTENRKIVLQ